MALNDEVRTYWEQEACGTQKKVVGGLEKFSRDWFERVESHRYQVEPFIHSIAQFTRHHGKKLLEVGVGAGTDHLQWARAGLDCHGVDLTDEGIEATRRRLEIYGLNSNLQRINAETLPFENDSFDVVYSWGVIHHSENPQKIITEIHRVLRKKGVFIGMMYGRYSIASLKMWVTYALLKGKPWKSIADVIWNHMESIGTKAYTVPELKNLFSTFNNFEGTPITTPAELHNMPKWIERFIPSSWGFFIAINAEK
ncbi:MAG: class I SAM-dependent methyltransferase [Nitrospinota bacterium]|nr:class I SAM-dependent methyltransferase [Nitrospinota bacterium]